MNDDEGRGFGDTRGGVRISGSTGNGMMKEEAIKDVLKRILSRICCINVHVVPADI